MNYQKVCKKIKLSQICSLIFWVILGFLLFIPVTIAYIGGFYVNSFPLNICLPMMASSYIPGMGMCFVYERLKKKKREVTLPLQEQILKRMEDTLQEIKYQKEDHTLIIIEEYDKENFHSISHLINDMILILT